MGVAVLFRESSPKDESVRQRTFGVRTHPRLAFMHDQQTMRLANAFPNQIGHLAVHRFFLNIQCRAKAGTRKKNTITTRSSMKNSSTSLPNSFSSVLKRCVAQDAPVFQNSNVAPK